jgi:peptidoglycan/xylan/chitin deacetylase (PgdA/CDA1 family)
MRDAVRFAPCVVWRVLILALGTALLLSGPVVAANAEDSSVPASSTPSTPSIPTPVGFPVKRFLGKPIHRVGTAKREVAITFDDGPSPQTDEIVRILSKSGVHATFFFCGRSVRGRGVDDVRAAALSGNDVGNHTFHHRVLKGVSTRLVRTEIDSNQRVLGDVLGYQPRFVRPRSGLYSPAALREMKSRKLVLVEWSTSAGDAGARPPVSRIVRNATSGVGPGSIILLHETNPDTVRALPRVLAVLKKRNLKPVTMSQLLRDARSSR